jgi:hypothetical protein
MSSGKCWLTYRRIVFLTSLWLSNQAKDCSLTVIHQWTWSNTSEDLNLS